MDTQKTVTISGREWTLTRARPDEQFEIECIMIRMLGPAAAVGIGVIVEALALEVAEYFDSVTGRGEDFELANLVDIDTADPRLGKVWGQFLAALPEVGGKLLGESLPVFLARLDHKDIIRLVHLAVLGKVLVKIDAGSPRVVADFKTMGMALGPSPKAKWTLLAEAIRFNYADELAAAKVAVARIKKSADEAAAAAEAAQDEDAEETEGVEPEVAPE